MASGACGDVWVLERATNYRQDRFNTMKVSHYYSLVQALLKAVKKVSANQGYKFLLTNTLIATWRCTLMQSCTNQSSGEHVVNYPIKTKSLLLTSSAFGEVFWDCFGEALASIGWGGVAGEAGSALSDFSAPSCQEIAVMDFSFFGIDTSSSFW